MAQEINSIVVPYMSWIAQLVRALVRKAKGPGQNFSLQILNDCIKLKLNPWHSAPKSQDRLKRLLPYDSTGGLVVSKALSLNHNFIFLNQILLLLNSSSYPIVFTRLGGPCSRPYTFRNISRVQLGIDPGTSWMAVRCANHYIKEVVIHDHQHLVLPYDEILSYIHQKIYFIKILIIAIFLKLIHSFIPVHSLYDTYDMGFDIVNQLSVSQTWVCDPQGVVK